MQVHFKQVDTCYLLDSVDCKDVHDFSLEEQFELKRSILYTKADRKTCYVDLYFDLCVPKVHKSREYHQVLGDMHTLKQIVMKLEAEGIFVTFL